MAKANRTSHIELMKSLTIGVEIELGTVPGAYSQADRNKKVCKIIAEALGATEFDVYRVGGFYQKYAVKDTKGREWVSMSDGSAGVAAELVTPILKYDDIELLQNVIRALRVQGKCKVNNDCGIHVHVGAQGRSVKDLRNLAKLVRKQENLMGKAFRVNHWCKNMADRFFEKIEKHTPADMEALREVWYQGNGAGYTNWNEHYNSSRYHALNFHSVFTKGTIEFRLFEATLHAGKVKAYVQFCLALVAKAVHAKAVHGGEPRPYNAAKAKYDMRVFLLNLGLIGEEFATARLHILRKLDGDSAYRNGRPRATVTVGFTQAGEAVTVQNEAVAA